MPAHSPPSPSLIPAKRPRQTSPDHRSPISATAATTGAAAAAARAPLSVVDLSGGEAAGGGDGTAATVSVAVGTGAKSGQSSNFRNVSACNRCRLRKNRCDQRLPSCVSCEKAGVACVGYDPITKREIPRSYVYYLETRVEQLEGLLRANSISYPPADELEHSSTARSPTDAARSVQSEQPEGAGGNGGGGGGGSIAVATGGSSGSSGLSNNTGTDGGAMAQATGSRPHRMQVKAGGRDNSSGQRHQHQHQHHHGSTAGVSFARVVFAAVQSSVTDQKSVSDKNGVRPYRPIAGNGALSSGTSMRDSFFGLHTKPTIRPATFPDRALGLRLVRLYFEHANPQIPVLHREDFMHTFELAYADEAHGRGPKELYMLNMVFAIGGGIIMGDTAKPESGSNGSDGSSSNSNSNSNSNSGWTRQCQPEEYHASAIIHLEACLSNSGGGLEELQAVLLLANFALLRPVPPGLWYIVGVAVRLAVDLGLYYEDGKDVDAGLPHSDVVPTEVIERERGRREYVRDLRRRLWWCTYSFDRLVSVCVGRPPGVPDQVMTTEFPSLLDDRYITATGFLRREHDPAEPSYKRAAHHYFRLRLLQSEILQVLQFQQAQMARATSSGNRPFAEGKPFMNYDLPCPYLAGFDSFRSWRIDIDRRLYKWKSSVPPKADNGVAFSTEFLVLNYWQAIIMLYRQSLSVPAVFEGEYHTSKEVNSPTAYHSELREDEDRVYLKVAEAGQKILRMYRQLHLVGLVNYTYLATHHLFMAGISYLYAIWHSPIVRSRLTMDEVDFTILAATSVFSDLMDKCPPAEACRDAFDRTAKATIKMANAKGGFGQPALGHGHGHRPRQRSSSRGSMENQRVDWAYSPATDEPTPTPNPGHRPPPRPYRMATGSGGGSTAAAAVKLEGDGFSLMQNTPGVPRSSGSSGDMVGTPDGSIMDQASIHAAASPSGVARPPIVSPLQTSTSMQGTPPASLMNLQQQQQQQMLTQQNVASVYTPSSQAYSDLQGMDFLQNFSGGGVGGDQLFGGSAFATEPPMDMGLSFGWEGMHHDFNDGQQLDLFDGFFFGGQQGGGGM